MIEQKPKPCKGIGKANGVKGCGNEFKHRTYGLCSSCLSDFLFGTDAGKLIMQKRVIPKAKAAVKSTERQKRNEAKRKLISPDQYRTKYVQPIINEIARLIDFGQPCICTGTYGKNQAGHYISVGANRTICMNLHGIHMQSYHSNVEKSGDTIKYQQGIIRTYPDGYLAFMDSLQAHRPIKLSIADLETIKKKASGIRNNLRQVEFKRTPQRRIELRNEINVQLGIYDEPYNTFQL